MAWSAVDEAVRNAVVGGADPDQLSLLDNFAWGNPNDPVTLARLIAACRGCHDAAVAHGAPFVSGKDSLYNEFVHPDGTRDPVTATLIITAVGIARDISTIPSVGLTTVGNDVWLVGPEAGFLGGSYLDEITGVDRGGDVPGSDRTAAIDAISHHRQVADAIANGLVASAHDVSEGGLAAAAAEWAFAGRQGLTLTVANRPEVLFGEELGRYLLEVAPGAADQLQDLLPDARRIGQVVEGDQVTVGEADNPAIVLTLAQIGRAYTGASGDGASDDAAPGSASASEPANG
jgi:phosphoribosylformylglycinamidine synthase